MEDSFKNQFRSEAQHHGTSEDTTSFFESSAPEQTSRAGSSDMEFAPMPSHHFGQYGSTFDMRHMSNALPSYGQHRYVHPQHQIPMMDSNTSYVSLNQQFASQIANQYPRQHPQNIHSQSRGQSAYTTGINSGPDVQVQASYYTPQQQSSYGMNLSQHNQYPTYQNHQSGGYNQMQNQGYQSRAAPFSVPRLQVDSQLIRQGSSSQSPELIRRNSSNSSLQNSSTLRGPPRKPKQSGYALWVGNLPPGTQIIDLKDHFSRDATDDIESVFLISKSNCAFVNYRTEETCAAAMNRFHDSRFRGVRLVCRLRRGSSSAASPASTSMVQVDGKAITAPTPASEAATLVDGEAQSSPVAMHNGKIAKEKFFIVKSLTMEDLERSVSSGIWATQAHNEENLNLAFKTAENVYLIFSANKSGEYFGYARMNSSISADAVPLMKEEAPKVPLTSPSPADAPLTIPTPATITAPRGHIIDDSARGTIFWEAESDSLTPKSAGETPADSGETSGEDVSPRGAGTQQSTFGKPFQITWQSTEKLPFYRTRGLRNPWNANREVKIARDGTELEPTVGRKLIGMFEQQAQINAAARSSGPPPQFVYPQQVPQYASMMPQGAYGYGGPSPPYGRPY